MDSRKLRVFVAIVDHGGVTAAAARLQLAQPSVSQTLRSIEHELGFELFVRVGRGLQLTAPGAALLGPAREAIRGLDAFDDAVGESRDVERGELHLAALSSLASDPLARVVGAFRRSHPSIVVRILEAEGVTALTRAVRDGSCELGLVDLPLAARDLTTILLGQQEMVLALPPGTSVGPGPLSPTSLAATPLVVAPVGTSTRTLLERAFADAQIEPLVAVETAAREATVPLVLAGAGAALLPASVAAEAHRRGATVRSTKPRIKRQIGLAHRQGNLSPTAAAFLSQAIATQAGTLQHRTVGRRDR
jgi:LysR family transcriptional regulator, carnitine catabolism transcriptional activator